MGIRNRRREYDKEINARYNNQPPNPAINAMKAQRHHNKHNKQVRLKQQHTERLQRNQRAWTRIKGILKERFAHIPMGRDGISVRIRKRDGSIRLAELNNVYAGSYIR